MVKKTPTARPGGILMFTKQSSSCLGCKAVVPQGESLCKHCLPKIGGIYASKLGEMNRNQASLSEVLLMLFLSHRICTALLHAAPKIIIILFCCGFNSSSSDSLQ